MELETWETGEYFPDREFLSTEKGQGINPPNTGKFEKILDKFDKNDKSGKLVSPSQEWGPLNSCEESAEYEHLKIYFLVPKWQGGCYD